MRSALALLAPVGALLESALHMGGPLSAVVLAGLLGAVTTLAALAVALVAIALAGLPPAPRTGAHRESAGLRVLVWQRNPDADGHVRSRAPGVAVPAA